MHHMPHSCLLVLGCSVNDVKETLPVSRVFSSQIPGYDGGEVDTNETVEMVFPIIVRRYSCKATISIIATCTCHA